MDNFLASELKKIQEETLQTNESVLTKQKVLSDLQDVVRSQNEQIQKQLCQIAADQEKIDHHECNQHELQQELMSLRQKFEFLNTLLGKMSKDSDVSKRELANIQAMCDETISVDDITSKYNMILQQFKKEEDAVAAEIAAFESWKEAELKVLKDNEKTLEKSVEEKRKIIEALREKIAIQEEEYVQGQSELEELNKVNATVEEEISVLETTKQSIIESEANEDEVRKQQVTELQQIIDKCQSELIIAQQENEALKEISKTLSESRQSLQNDVHDKTISVSNLKDQNDLLKNWLKNEEECDYKLRMEVAEELNVHLESLLDMNWKDVQQQISNERQKVDDELTELELKYKELSSTEKALSSKAEQVQAESKEISEKSDEMQMKIQTAEQQLKHLQEEYNTKQKQHAADRNEYQEKLIAVALENEKIRKELLAAEDNLKAQERILREGQIEIEEMQLKYSNERDAYAKEKDFYDHAVSEIDKDNDRLSFEIMQIERKIAAFSTPVKDKSKTKRPSQPVNDDQDSVSSVEGVLGLDWLRRMTAKKSKHT